MKILYIPIYVVNYIANYLNFFVIEQSKVFYIDVGHGYVGDKFEIFVPTTNVVTNITIAIQQPMIISTVVELEIYSSVQLEDVSLKSGL